MLKLIIKKILLLAAFLVISPLISAAEFSANVSNTSIGVNETLQLELVLNDAKAKSDPDYSELTQEFAIFGQQQSKAYSNYNGVAHSVTTWHLNLIPKNAGELKIPAIEINTDQGPMQTKEIKIRVNADPSAKNKNDIQKNGDVGISMIAQTSKTRVYVKEPLIYTLKIVSFRNVTSFTFEDITSNDAIIDKIGQPREYTQSINGKLAHVLEVKYAITPLISGKIEILPAVFKGVLQELVPSPSTNKFGFMSNLFFDNFVLKPFHVKSPKITIEVKPPANKTSPWLPVNNLALTEEWEGLEKVMVGDTITRKIKIVADGSFSHQLPNLKSYLEFNDFKLYANNSNVDDKLSNNEQIIIGTRQEEYSIVPLKDGKIKLPEIKISWWNLRTNQSEIAVLPAKTIEVLPAISTSQQAGSLDTQPGIEQVQQAKLLKQDTKWLFVALIVAIIIILGLFLALIYSLRTKKTNPAKVQTLVNKYNKKEITSVNDLKEEIFAYAHEKWQTPVNISLKQLGNYLQDNNYFYEKIKYDQLVDNLNAAFYAGANVNLPTMITLWEEFKISVVRNKKLKSSQQKIDLNPT